MTGALEIGVATAPSANADAKGSVGRGSSSFPGRVLMAREGLAVRKHASLGPFGRLVKAASARSNWAIRAMPRRPTRHESRLLSGRRLAHHSAGERESF
jgi:hypothetical protein